MTWSWWDLCGCGHLRSEHELAGDAGVVCSSGTAPCTCSGWHEPAPSPPALRPPSVSVDVAALTHAHVALCQVEQELRDKGRLEAARGLAVADVVVLAYRHFLATGQPVGTPR